MPEEHHAHMSKLISRRFINGLILLVPLAITIFVVMETLHFTEGVLGKHLPFYFPGMGIITLLLFVYLTGWLSSYWLTKRFIGYGEWVLGKIPVVKFIYNSVKHLSTAVFESNSMCVFVPWSLNMTSGTNLFVPKKDVIYLDISSESALQYMLTAGAVMPKKVRNGSLPN